jgi:hypothetical protein
MVDEVCQNTRHRDRGLGIPAAQDVEAVAAKIVVAHG